MDFYKQLGFTVNPLFTFDNQKCMVWTDKIYVMLHRYEMFKKNNKQILPDTKYNTTATLTLPVESLEKVNEIMDNGLKAGGTEPTKLIDEGFMQISGIEDLDGHRWDFIYLDLNKFKELKGKNG